MDQTTLVYVMAGAIAVAALAIVVQAVLLAAIYSTNRRMREQVSTLVGKAEPALESAQRLLEELRRSASDITTKSGEIIELSRKQLLRLDEVLGEAATRSRAQMERLEMVLDDFISRFQETTALVQSGIIRPIRHINGLTAGIRAAVAALAGAKTTVAQATHDEEMFI